MSKVESKFQSALIKKLKEEYEGSFVLKMEQRQGLPDLLVLYNDKWATLECKRKEDSAKQPNQDYYVNRMNTMSFSRFVSPENEEEVLSELRRSFKPGRKTRLSRGESISLD